MSFAERAHEFVSRLEWEECPANAKASSDVGRWLCMKMGPSKRKAAGSILFTACNLAGVSMPAWAYK